MPENLYQRLACVHIRQARNSFERHGALLHLPGESGDVTGLLAGEAECDQRRLAERSDACGRNRTVEMQLEPRVERRCGGERNLLLEDDPHERREAAWPGPERRRTELVDDACKVAIARGQFAHAGEQ